jgi:hypothetical protein
MVRSLAGHQIPYSGPYLPRRWSRNGPGLRGLPVTATTRSAARYRCPWRWILAVSHSFIGENSPRRNCSSKSPRSARACAKHWAAYRFPRVYVGK